MSGFLDTVAKAVPAITPYVPHLRTGMERYDINTALRVSHFLAQMAVESGGFTTVEESLNYREDRIIPLFGAHRISAADAAKFGRSIDGKRPAHQNALANILYGGEWGRKNLGNKWPGDGWRFRGRGLKQITGKDNYEMVSQKLYGDYRLLCQPELLQQPEGAALSACIYWNERKLNVVADKDDVVAVTKLVNGGTNGLEGTGGRKWWLNRIRTLLKC